MFFALKALGSRKVILTILVAALAGCDGVRTPALSDIKEGGMTSGGWGQTSNGSFAVCSLALTEAASPDDALLSKAVIQESGIGAALWYELEVGDQEHNIESVQLGMGFHRFARPLPIDGTSIPLTRGGGDDYLNVGKTRLIPLNDEEFIAAASWTREDQTSSTVLRLTCKRSRPIKASLLGLTKCVEDAGYAASPDAPYTFRISGVGTGLRTIRVSHGAQDEELGTWDAASLTGSAESAIFTYLQADEKIQLSLYESATMNGEFLGFAFIESPVLGSGNVRLRCE